MQAKFFRFPVETDRDEPLRQKLVYVVLHARSRYLKNLPVSQACKPACWQLEVEAQQAQLS